MKRTRLFPAISLLIVLSLGFLLAAGCGADKQKMQDFVDGYLKVMEQLQSHPEVAQAGQQAAIQYSSSGFTDLDSAEKARLSYEQSVQNDTATLAELEKLQAPDDDSQKIKEELATGVAEVDKGSQMFAAGLAKAKDQTVEERQAEAQNIAEPMGQYAKGMATIVDSLSGLQDYITKNGLNGSSEAQNWYDKIKSELDMVKQYVPQQ